MAFDRTRHALALGASAIGEVRSTAADALQLGAGAVRSVLAATNGEAQVEPDPNTAAAPRKPKSISGTVNYGGQLDTEPNSALDGFIEFCRREFVEKVKCIIKEILPGAVNLGSRFPVCFPPFHVLLP